MRVSKADADHPEGLTTFATLLLPQKRVAKLVIVSKAGADARRSHETAAKPFRSLGSSVVAGLCEAGMDVQATLPTQSGLEELRLIRKFP